MQDQQCQHKYYNQTQSPYLSCEKSSWSQMWEYNTYQYGCINKKCCNDLHHYFLYDYYISIYLNYLNSSLILFLVAMLYYIKQSEHGEVITKSIKLIISIIFLIIIILTIFLTTPNIPIYRTMLLDEQQYNPSDNMIKLQRPHNPFKYQNIQSKMPFGCNNIHPLKEVIKDIKKKSDKEIQLLMYIDKGSFLILEQQLIEDMIILQDIQIPGIDSDYDNIYLKGKSEMVIQILDNNVKVCLTSVNSKFRWLINEQMEGQQFRGVDVKNKQQGKEGQQNKVLNQYLSFYDIYVDTSIANNTVRLFNSMLLQCQEQLIQSSVYMETQTNQSGIATFYNYASGIYGTVVGEYKHQHDCYKFIFNNELFINMNLQNLDQTELVLVLKWNGQADLDLLVQFNFTKSHNCLVGSKAISKCGLVEQLGNDNYGNQINTIGSAEQVRIRTLGKYDYRVLVRISEQNKGQYSLMNQQCVVSVFSKNSNYAIMNIEPNKEQSEWFVLLIKQGEQLIEQQ